MPNRARAGPRAEDTARSLLFLLLVYAALQAFLWLVVPTRNNALVIPGAVLILAVIFLDPWRRGEDAASAGAAGRDLLPALRLTAIPTVIGIALLIVLGLLVPGGGRGERFLKRLLEILPWALLQQGLLQATFNRRLEKALGPGLRSSAVNGLCFAGMHLPNPLLTAATFAAGAWWSRVYQRRPNLWALVLSHALLSATAQSFLPPEWTHGFRVGPGYFRWRP